MAILARAVASQWKSGSTLASTKNKNAVCLSTPLVLLHGQELQNNFGDACTVLQSAVVISSAPAAGQYSSQSA
jgi:hypothetical protein